MMGSQFRKMEIRGLGTDGKQRNTYVLLFSFTLLFIILSKTSLRTIMVSEDTSSGIMASQSSSSIYKNENSAVVNNNCPRYAFVANAAIENCGFGHRFGDVIMSYIFAMEYNATLVLQDGVLTASTVHGESYDWAPSFLGLSGYPTVSEIRQQNNRLKLRRVDRWDTAALYSEECDVILHTCDGCCIDTSHPEQDGPKDWCFIKKLSAYGVAAPFFRKKFAMSEFKPKEDAFQKLRDSKLSVAWHIRLPNYEGDHVDTRLQSEQFFDNVCDLLKRAFGKAPFQIYIFSQRPLEGFNYLDKYDPIYVATPDVAETLYHLATPDILVTSGSAFTSVAAVLHDLDSIVLQAPPRDTGNGVHWMPQFPMIDAQGTLLYPSFDILASRAALLSAKRQIT